MDFHGKKVDDQPVYPPAVAEQRRRQWAKIKEGGQFKSSLTVPRPGKTDKQLGAIWGLMMASAVIQLDDSGMDTSHLYKGVDEPTGVGITKDQLCLWLYGVCPIFDEGKAITLSSANTEQANKFFEDARNILASHFGIVIPDPNKDWNKS